MTVEYKINVCTKHVIHALSTFRVHLVCACLLAADQQDNQSPSFVQQIKVSVILQCAELHVANIIW